MRFSRIGGTVADIAWNYASSELVHRDNARILARLTASAQAPVLRRRFLDLKAVPIEATGYIFRTRALPAATHWTRTPAMLDVTLHSSWQVDGLDSTFDATGDHRIESVRHWNYW